jgi:Flp pilus assembly protein TadD
MLRRANIGSQAHLDLSISYPIARLRIAHLRGRDLSLRVSRKRNPPLKRKRTPGQRMTGILFFVLIVAAVLIAIRGKVLRKNPQSEVASAQSQPMVTSPAPVPGNGLDLVRTNRGGAATADWRTTIAGLPASDQGAAYSDKGDEFLARREYMDAANAYQLSVQSDNASESVYYNLGIALGKLGRIDEATNAYAQALKIAPDYAEVHNNLGNLLLRKGDLDGAARHFREVTKINPELAAGYNNLGITLARQSRHEDAAAQFRKAIELDPKYLEARFNLAHSFLAQRNAAGAADELRAVLTLDPGFKPARELLDKLAQTPLPQSRDQRTNE